MALLVPMTKPPVGTTTKKTSFADAVIDNLVDLESRIAAAGGAGGSALAGGSFETWAGGLPSGWNTDSPGGIYSGGSVNEETTDHAHGEKAMRITASSSSGGAAVVSGYFTVSPQRPVDVQAIYKGSVAGVLSKIEVYWYTAAQATSAVRTLDVAINITTSPTSYTLMRGVVIPPSDARYARVVVTGGVPGTAAGSAYFDDVFELQELPLASAESNGIAENQTQNYSWTDAGSAALVLPDLSVNSLARLTILSQLKGGTYYSDENGEWYYYAHQRFRIGTFYSTGNQVISATYVKFTSTLLIEGIGGSQTIYQQLYRESGAATPFGKVDPFRIVWEVLVP